jgi:VCBS repeat-containing protein
MAIATVVNVKGEVFAVNKEGVKRRLQKGDQLQEGEILVTAPGSSAELDMGGGKTVQVAEQQTFAVDGSVGGPAQPSAATSALESAAAAQKVIQALAAGDANALLEAEAAAAGLAGGGAADGGSSFVQLLRISEGVTPVSYDYGNFALGGADQPTPGAIEEITTPSNSPTILVGNDGLYAESASAQVFEAALPVGSNSEGEGEFVLGQFLVGDPDGIDTLVSVTINGVVIPMGDLVGTVIPGAHGTLTITGFDPNTGLADFTYQLTDVTTDVNGVTETDVFSFTTTDGTNTSNTATVTIDIVDDVPTAEDDVAPTLVEDGEGGAVVSGNVLENDSAGADTPKTFSAWDDAANADAVAALAAYGTLELNAGGSYSFTLNNALPAVQALTSDSDLSFVLAYTMEDADGDPSTATLTINIQGADDTASVTVAAQGADSTVYEAGLTSVPDTSETDGNDSFQVSATDGIASVTVGGTTFTLDQLKGFSSSSPSGGISTGEGTLIITGYSSADGDKTATISYSYTLNAAQTHTQPANDTTLTDSVTVSVAGIGGTSASANLTINIIDDVPENFVPTSAHLVDRATSPSITLPLNFAAAVGADGVQTVKFDITEGDPATDLEGNPLTFNGDALYLHYDGADQTKLIAKTAEGIIGFTIDIDPSGDTYTIHSNGVIANGTETSATDLTGVGGGNVPWKALYGQIDSPDKQGDYALANTSQDVLLSTATGFTVNTNANQIGIGEGNSFTSGEGIRFDFVNDLEADKVGNDWTYTYGGTHNLTNAFRQEVDFVLGSGSATIKVTAIVADDDAPFNQTGISGFYGDTTGEAAARIKLSDVRAFYYTDPVNKTGLVDVTSLITVTGNGVDDNGYTSINISGLKQGWWFEIKSDTDFSAVQIDALSGTSEFKLGEFSYGESSAGEPINLSYDITGYDTDGDFISSTINATLYPAGATIEGTDASQALAGTAQTNYMFGYGGDDVLSGGAGDDVLIGGIGGDTFKWTLGDQGTVTTPAVDIIADFGNGTDKIDLKDLLQGEESGDLTDYLSFDYVEATNSTIVNVSTHGDGVVDQQIVLAAVDITDEGALNDATIIANLLSQQKLVVDS